MMKKIIIYVFSGTGNTRIAAQQIGEALSARGFAVTVWEARLPFATAPDPNDFDMAGFGYPVHAFNTPRFFLRFVKTLAAVNAMPAFIFKTSGEPFRFNDASSWPLVRILREMGFIPMIDQHLLMPYNIVFRYNDALAKQMYNHTKDMAGVVAERVAAGVAQKLRYDPWTILWLYLFRLQWLGARINGPLIHVKKDLCAGCGLCADKCPAHNIRMVNGIPRFSSNCTMCMGCVFRCPQDAVRPGFLNLWRVNGEYPFDRLAEDASVPAIYVNENTEGYFRRFRSYYKRTYAEIREYESRRDHLSS